jgi:hypothetical protein
MDKYTIHFEDGGSAIIETSTNRWGIDDRITLKQFRDVKGKVVFNFAEARVKSVDVLIHNRQSQNRFS